jgi:hypothetical protein
VKQSPQFGKNFIRALCGAGYNLKHFVTATPGQFAHNQFNDFNTDVIGSVCAAGSTTDGRRDNAEALKRDIRVGTVGRFLLCFVIGPFPRLVSSR